ncbi:MAG TPA: polysaccharide biosynthesis/export family protein [Pseudolabrys sp.]|nr:polysaccharide biosynthesis/export family protein [Pseudolabrys sp.]
MLRIECLIVSGLALMTLSGCMVAAGQEASLPPETVLPSQTRGSAYLLGPSDRVRVKVYNEPDITGEYEVSRNGIVSIPLAGDIRAAGQTTRQLEQSIRARLAKGVITDPRVNVEVAIYAPFYIQGEVKRAGEYPYRPGLTVNDAVALAGGYSYRANEQKVFLQRAGAREVTVVYPTDAPIAVLPGDNIRIPERYF